MKTKMMKNKEKEFALRLDIQHFAATRTLYDLKLDMDTLGQQYAKAETEYSTMLTDIKATPEDIKKAGNMRDEMKMRFEGIKEQHDSMEAEQRAKLTMERKEKSQASNDPKMQVVNAKAELIRSTMLGKPVSNDIRMALGDDATGGGKFLPKTVSNDIIMEPLTKNPLRNDSTFTSITNLEIPKLDFQLDDDDFIEDKETAKELELTGDVVSFGRNKFKVFAGVSETITNGTNTTLVSHVENALRSGVAAKEKKVAFTETPKAGEEHMSFYSAENNIKRVQGESTYHAILNAIADLHEDYRENAKVYMVFADYLKMIGALANGNATLYTAQPEQILGKPVVFVDAAKKPIVGDFSKSHFNYDLGQLYDRDKDVKTGVELFVVTAWFDHQIKLKSAFRIAEVVDPSVTPTP